MIAQVLAITTGECVAAALVTTAFAHLLDFSRLPDAEASATKDRRLLFSIGLFLFTFVIFMISL